jgi:hypothetical protein
MDVQFVAVLSIVPPLRLRSGQALGGLGRRRPPKGGTTNGFGARFWPKRELLVKRWTVHLAMLVVVPALIAKLP